MVRSFRSLRTSRVTVARERSWNARIETLESRLLLHASASLSGGLLSIVGSAHRDELSVLLDEGSSQVVVRNSESEVGRFALAGVLAIDIESGGGFDSVVVDSRLTQAARIDGGSGDDLIRAGSGPTTILGGQGNDRLFGGRAGDSIAGGEGKDKIRGGGGADSIEGGAGSDSLWGGEGNDSILGAAGRDQIFGAMGADDLFGGPEADLLIGGEGNDRLAGGEGIDRLLAGGGSDLDVDAAVLLSASAVGDAAALEASLFADGFTDTELLTANEVRALLQRAAAASASDDAIIVVVDRNGVPLEVRVEAGVDPAITGNPDLLVFAVDGALAKARTASFFANNGAPLTSRTIQFISQTTITEREVDSNPSITDESSPLRGPGFVAPVGLGGHFPPNVANTPQVDLFAIEHSNRDSLIHPGADRIKGTADDYDLTQVNAAIGRPLGGGRFNIDNRFVPAGRDLTAPESFGATSGLRPNAASRGIATLPGGIPLYKNGKLVGGIGVFFPGSTGYASEENSALSALHDPTLPDRSFESEFIAFVAAGGSSAAGFGFAQVDGAPALPGFDLPFGRIDLVGITLDIFGPGGNKGTENLVAFGRTLGFGAPNSGQDLLVDGAVPYLPGTASPEGWLVAPHDGVGLTANDVVRIISTGVAESQRVRAAIRLPLDSRTRMIFAVTDETGEVLGLFRMPDATLFSIDVAVAKARNVAYYADPNELQAEDRLDGVALGAALSSRTFRYVAEPRLPEGIDRLPPGPFSILVDGGVDPSTGAQVGAPLPASAFDSVLGFDAFHPSTNFRDPFDILNQNGVVFFPGSSPIYKDTDGDGVPEIVGGLGVSGDGVDQDDVVTFAAQNGFGAPLELRADQFFVRGARLPYQKFNRNPRG